MNLRELIGGIGESSQPLSEAEVSHLTPDSREVSPGSVFVAVRGETVDGHDFIEKAVSQGAVAVIVDAGFNAPAELATKTAVVKVPDTRVAQDQLARRFYQDPSQRMLCIGVTGTNGKTSVTYLLEHLLNQSRVQTGVIGTINHHLGNHIWPTQHTTPEPILLQKRLSEMKGEGAQAVAMEVSSHALAQSRVDGIQFNIGIFTNLTRDHLDYHKTMEHYFAAKQRLFTDLFWNSSKMPLFAIVNRDDPWGRRLRVSSKAGIWTYGAARKNRSEEADFAFTIDEMSFSGMHLRMETPFGPFEGDVPMCGVHNAYNIAAAVAAVATIGVPVDQALHLMAFFNGVPGRLQKVSGISKNVFVDYAHTPDALEKALATLHDVRRRATVQGQIITVFGCGGDRDKGKRPEMARIAELSSDQIVVTSDNPRTENPDQILNEVMAGFSPEGRQKVHRESDRKKAIAMAVQMCRPGDVVLVAGKGHEDYQQIGTQKYPFSDVKVVQEVCG